MTKQLPQSYYLFSFSVKPLFEISNKLIIQSVCGTLSYFVICCEQEDNIKLKFVGSRPYTDIDVHRLQYEEDIKVGKLRIC